MCIVNRLLEEKLLVLCRVDHEVFTAVRLLQS